MIGIHKKVVLEFYRVGTGSESRVLALETRVCVHACRGQRDMHMHTVRECVPCACAYSAHEDAA